MKKGFIRGEETQTHTHTASKQKVLQDRKMKSFIFYDSLLLHVCKVK